MTTRSMPAGASEFAGDYACRVRSIRALLERLVAIESVNPTLVAGGAVWVVAEGDCVRGIDPQTGLG